MADDLKLAPAVGLTSWGVWHPEVEAVSPAITERRIIMRWSGTGASVGLTLSLLVSSAALSDQTQGPKSGLRSAGGSLQADAAGKDPTTKLWEWERGIVVESREQKGLAVFLWFYEWNMFDAVTKGEHTPGTFKHPRKVNPKQTEAVIGRDGMQLTVKAAEGGADLTLTITNQSGHDWPAIAGIIPCFSPGRSGDGPHTPAFANEKTYFLGPRGLELLQKREIHFNDQYRKAVEAVSRKGRFVFSDKWPTAEPDARGGILLRESTDGRWVAGIAWEDYLSVQGHNPWQCMHLCVRVGPLQQGATRTVRGKVYLFPGAKEDGLKRYLRDFNVAAPKP
jgi:hypothetical protein